VGQTPDFVANFVVIFLLLLETTRGLYAQKGVSTREQWSFRPEAPEYFQLKSSWSCFNDTKCLVLLILAGTRRRATELYGFAELLGSKGLSHFGSMRDGYSEVFSPYAEEEYSWTRLSRECITKTNSETMLPSTAIHLR
jgi:hypothetical protein